jgi:hypothetical protein
MEAGCTKSAVFAKQKTKAKNRQGRFAAVFMEFCQDKP